MLLVKRCISELVGFGGMVMLGCFVCFWLLLGTQLRKRPTRVVKVAQVLGSVKEDFDGDKLQSFLRFFGSHDSAVFG